LRHLGAPEQDDAPVGGAGGGLRALGCPEPMEELAILGIRGRRPVVLAALVLPEAVLVHGGSREAVSCPKWFRRTSLGERRCLGGPARSVAGRG